LRPSERYQQPNPRFRTRFLAKAQEPASAPASCDVLALTSSRYREEDVLGLIGQQRLFDVVDVGEPLLVPFKRCIDKTLLAELRDDGAAQAFGRAGRAKRVARHRFALLLAPIGPGEGTGTQVGCFPLQLLEPIEVRDTLGGAPSAEGC
jgi:hypothetical protein